MKQIKKINWLKVVEVVVAAAMLVMPLVAVHAQLQTNNQALCQGTGLNCQATNVNSLIKTVINWLLGIAFGIAVLFLIIGGFWYITSAGNEETAEKGKNTAINAIIGIVIIILSYVIVNVVANLVSSSGGNTGP
ncbi:MAG: TrbC/VirB2 family protein [Patescibacteria group bacterium]|nr:TrbC/VirB2 family protein [Patescibacteria group bacterium]